MECPQKDVRLAVTSCLTKITPITMPILPYNDYVLRKPFQLIVKSLQGLHDDKGLACAKRIKILETMTKVRSFTIMNDLECNFFTYFNASWMKSENLIQKM